MRSFFLWPWFPDYPAAPEAVFYWHGALFTAWYVLLVAQSVLIATGRVAVHRSLGCVGAVLAALMVVFGSYVALVAWDIGSRRRIHPATFWGSALVVASQPLRLMMSGTEPWLAFAAQAVDLVH